MTALARLLDQRRSPRHRRRRELAVDAGGEAGGAAGCALLGITVIRLAAQSAPAGAATDAPLPDKIEFNRDVRPILSDRCFKCHGPGTQFATLRFDLEDGAKHELSGGRHAIVPGDPANSQMIARVTATDPQIRMPRGPGGTGETSASPALRSIPAMRACAYCT